MSDTDQRTYDTHGIGYGGGRYPAVCVKVRNLHTPNADALADHGIDDVDAFTTWLEELDESDRTRLDHTAFEWATHDWWQDTLPLIIEQYNEEARASHGETFDRDKFQCEGRSGGWVVLIEDHLGYNDGAAWTGMRHASFSALALRIQQSALTDGHHTYWWQLGAIATGPGYGYGQPTPSDPYAVIGQLTVTDEQGHTRTLKIRREDLTTTNAGYGAIRDACVELLSETLRANREAR